MTSATPLTDRLNELTVEAEAQKARARRAEQAAGPEARFALQNEVLRDYTEHREYRPSALTLQQWSHSLIEELIARNLALDLRNDTAYVVVDPQVEIELDEAEAARMAAIRARREFESVNKDGLLDEAKAEKAAQFKEAVEAGDVDQVRELVAGS
jgi:hypothetical protein